MHQFMNNLVNFIQHVLLISTKHEQAVLDYLVNWFAAVGEISASSDGFQKPTTF